ncbi:MAG: ATP-binding protein [Myxococcales bacterium]|nr:ATP-binding protein [Myxococcales bacterium]
MKIDGVPAAHSILVDRALIVVALADLVRNSIEAVAENGTVVVRASRSTDQQRVCFIVSDSGSGIPEDLRDRGSELYFTTKESGTGLGLAVVKHIVEAHGGQLKIESGDDGGTTVKIDLPDRSPAQ